MPDISMCATGADCPKRETCHRWTAIPTEGRQSWMGFEPGDECKDYWPDWGYRRTSKEERDQRVRETK